MDQSAEHATSRIPQTDPAERPQTQNARPVRASVLRGWRRRCPNCGSGALFQGYLTVAHSCSVCDQELHHQKADDGPAYLTILIVGHVMAPFLHFGYAYFRPEPLVLFSVLAVGCVALSLYLLPRIKGAIVGYQWAKKMYGFGASN